jgi:predicted NAD-dependent protein-ADP-ribosyltransferase YbiA (DUF1768 family)
METIKGFKGKYEFLDNMFNCHINFNGEEFINSESAYLANIIKDTKQKSKFYRTTGMEANKLVHRMNIREDLNSICINLMYEILKCKFNQNNRLKIKLIETNTDILIYYNYWGETFWGICNDKGNNFLGKILMIIRDEFIKESII